jgi:hypothetical protein
MILVSAASVRADTDYFTFTGDDVDNFSFSLPSEFHSTTGGNEIGIYPTTDVTLNGMTSVRQIGFYVPGNLGGLAFTSSTHPYSFEGLQLFTADLYAPFPWVSFYKDAIFIPGTFMLQEVAGDKVGGFGTLVVSDVPPGANSAVPEPSTITFFMIGLLSAGGFFIKRSNSYQQGRI